jgi:hypothetical protein
MHAAIAKILGQLNGRVMRRFGVSRRELFETVERPVMRALPDTEYDYAEWALARVGIHPIPKLVQVSAQLCLEPLNRLGVDPRRSLVGSYM